MIYQLFPDAQRETAPFGPLYRLFGLDPTLNPHLTDACPELEPLENRYALSEYAAMLHFWRNPDRDSDPWIGFTSCRQQAKVAYVVTQEDARLAAYYDVITWNWWRPGSLIDQAESRHPGINDAIAHVFKECGQSLPALWFSSDSGVFANYWLMNKGTFNEWMTWSFPTVNWMLCNSQTHPFLAKELRHEVGIGYIMERMFIIWCYKYNKSVFDLVQSSIV